MAKSRAEVMREYRKRMKQDPTKYQKYLADARSRKRQNYVAAVNLPSRERSRRNEKNKEYLQRHRQKKKRERAIENARGELDQPTPETSGYDTGHSESTPMVVNMQFPNRRNGPRKRTSKALAKKQKELRKLKTDFENLQLKYKRTLRNLQRAKKSRTKSFESNNANTSEREETGEIGVTMSTPNTKTKHLMRTASLSRGQQSKIHKQLLFSFAVQDQMKNETRSVKATEKGSLRTLIGTILKKYGLKNSVSKNTGLARNCLKGLSIHDIKRQRETRIHREKVTKFLLRDDNTRANPGKRDKLKTKEGLEQTRTLTDYMKNLHQKFLGENPFVKLSLASFCRLRPRHIKLSAFITRDSCLCTRHQNMALSARALRGCGLVVPINPEEFVKDDNVKKIIEDELPDTIKVGQWKRVPLEEKGRKKMIIKVVESELKREEFLKFVQNQMEEFRYHVCRIKRQYEEIRNLKVNMSDSEIIMHMDFAENYTCKSVEEVQTAYWNKTGVTLHPVVVYYREENGSLSHKSIIVVSDEQAHNSTTVLTFLDNVIPVVKNLVKGDLQRIHYWTDSPTSQYRNKTIFDAVERHEELFGVKSTWNYFEAGHGKGPCDGLGGLTKRLADEAVNMGKATIQDANDFYAWTQSSACTMKSVDFIFVTSTECQRKVEAVGLTVVKPIPGTMKMHAVVGGIESGTVYVADVSCYCASCIHEDMCAHWKKERVIRSDKIPNSTVKNAEQAQDQVINNQIENPPQQREVNNKAGPIKKITQKDEYSAKEATSEFAEYDSNNNVSTEVSVSPEHDESSSESEEREPIVQKENSNRQGYEEGDYVAAVYADRWYIGEIIDIDGSEIEINFMKTTKCMTYQWPNEEDKLWLESKDILAKVNKPKATGRSKRAYKLDEEDLSWSILCLPRDILVVISNEPFIRILHSSLTNYMQHL